MTGTIKINILKKKLLEILFKFLFAKKALIQIFYIFFLDFDKNFLLLFMLSLFPLFFALNLLFQGCYNLFEKTKKYLFFFH